MKILQFVLTSQAKYIQPELRKQRDKIEANVVEKWMINGRRMPELASHLAISGAFQVHRRLLLWSSRSIDIYIQESLGLTILLQNHPAAVV